MCPDIDPIDDFKSWALKLGCPVNALPSDAALNRFIKSNHHQTLMNQIQSKTEVKLFRDNLLSEGHHLSKNFMNLKKVEKLNHQISVIKPRVDRLKIQVKDKKSSLSEKVDRLKRDEKVQSNMQIKCTILKQKHSQLMEKMYEENKFDAMLADGMHVQITDSMNKKVEAEKSVKKSVELLRNAYAEVGDGEFTKSHREKMEREIKQRMADIPVAILFDAIKFYSLSDMNAINDKFNSIHVHSSNVSLSSAFDVAITKSRMKIYVDHLKKKALKEEHAIRVEHYIHLYDQYLARIVDEMKVFNGPDVELFAESICGDYLKQYGTSLCNQALLQFKQQKLLNLVQLAKERDDLLNGNELITAQLSGMYASIEKTYNLTLDDITSLGDVNKNMKQLQALSKYTINSLGNVSICNTSTNSLNCSLGSAVLSIANNMAPAEYQNELSMLVDVEDEKWNQLNPQISMDVECQCPHEKISPFYLLLTPNNALKEMKFKLTWRKVMDALTTFLDVDDYALQSTDTELVSSNLKKETIKMLKSMEDVKFMYQTGNKTVSEIRKYLAFLLDKSLGSFIPERVMIKRRNFLDYEEEFLCACSLITNSMKKM